MPALTNPNIHNHLVISGWTMNFEGIRTLKPRQRYVGVQYSPEIREKLKFAKGESGFGTVLAMEKKLNPVAILQCLPTENETAWWVALNVPRRKAVYGYEKPISENSWDRPARLLTDLRKSSFHGPDTDGALFYIRESPGYLVYNPWCTEYWSTDQGSWGFVTGGYPNPRPRYVKASEFIGDAFPELCFVAYPPPETKPKTVNEWDRPALPPREADDLRGMSYLAQVCPWVSASDIQDAWMRTNPAYNLDRRTSEAREYLQLQYGMRPEPAPIYQPDYVTAWYQQQYDNIVARNINAPLKKAAPPPEPEIESKTGRLIILDDD